MNSSCNPQDRPDIHDLNRGLVEVDGVSLRYGETAALDNITFRLHKGERVAVVGPNGAGKSSLFNIIAGLLRPQVGSVAFYGHAPSQHLCIAYVPQRSQIDWQFPVSVTNVVMMGRVGKLGLFRRPKQEDRDRVAEALELVEMSHLAQRQIGELSGGQQQRIFIARALAQEAELVLMDEPVSGLDVQSQEGVFAILDMLQEQQITVMVSTHDLGTVAERFDRLMLLNRRLIAFGRTDQVFTMDLLNRTYDGRLGVISTISGNAASGDAASGEVAQGVLALSHNSNRVPS